MKQHLQKYNAVMELLHQNLQRRNLMRKSSEI
jgi:hypothetical protein